MDREIAVSERRAHLVRKVAIVVAIAIVAFAAIAVSARWMRPSVRRSQIEIATVTRGPITEVIEATGTVVPAAETVLSSPVDARVVRIVAKAGTAVHAGDEILQLDTSASRLDVERLRDRVAQKERELDQERLELEKDMVDLTSRIEQQQLDSEVASYKLEQQRMLRDQGLLSEQQFRQTEAEARKAAIALEQLRKLVGNSRSMSAGRISTLELDLGILRKEHEEARRQLELATTRADRDGVVTWVIAEEGVTLQKGQLFARIADLSSFRVEASASDIHASRLVPGAVVEVRAGETLRVAGTIAAVRPAVENGTIRFDVTLAEPAHRALRNAMRVDVLVASGSHPQAMKVRRGRFARGERSQEVFVVRGDRAIKTRIETGLYGRDEIEITSGLAVGDELVVSDMSDYEHAKELSLK
ncbi:MAG: HlyD family efflux transporter periplasmic adaptor subunit [Thermoanaerobaculia bacterium]|jgi:HlyD family secretion protein